MPSFLEPIVNGMPPYSPMSRTSRVKAVDPMCDSFSDVFSVDWLITSFGWGDSDDDRNGLMWMEFGLNDVT